MRSGIAYTGTVSGLKASILPVLRRAGMRGLSLRNDALRIQMMLDGARK